MKFSRSFLGYSKSQVDEELYNLMVKLGDEKKSLIEEYNEAVREHNRLLTQHNALRSTLESARATASLMRRYDQDHRDKILQGIQSAAKAKVESVEADRDAIIAEIEQKVAEIDRYTDLLKQELSTIAREIGALAGSINSHHHISEQIQATDLEIEQYRELASSQEPFTAFTPEVAAQLMPIAMIEPGSATPHSMELPLSTTHFSITEGVSTQSSVTQLAPQQIDAAPSPVTILDEPTITSSTITRPLVLVAENDRDTGALLSSLVEREGFDPILVADGYALNNMVKNMEPPALIVVNTLLPYMDINHFIKEVRQSARWCKVPIMVLTAEHSKQSIIHALEAGANDSMEKPFNPREFAARVKGLTRRGEGVVCS